MVENLYYKTFSTKVKGKCLSKQIFPLFSYYSLTGWKKIVRKLPLPDLILPIMKIAPQTRNATAKNAIDLALVWKALKSMQKDGSFYSYMGDPLNLLIIV